MVSAEGSFHGRTLGALSITGQPAKRAPFEPLLGPVTFVPYGDLASLREAVSEQTAAVFLEPIQGEGGLVTPPPGYLAEARAICDRTGALLVVDEVQSGIARSGSWFASRGEAVLPDVVTLAKRLGGWPAHRGGDRDRAGRDAVAARRSRHHVRWEPGCLRCRAGGPRRDRGERPPGPRAVHGRAPGRPASRAAGPAAGRCPRPRAAGSVWCSSSRSRRSSKRPPVRPGFSSTLSHPLWCDWRRRWSSPTPSSAGSWNGFPRSHERRNGQRDCRVPVGLQSE